MIHHSDGGDFPPIWTGDEHDPARPVPHLADKKGGLYEPKWGGLPPGSLMDLTSVTVTVMVRKDPAARPGRILPCSSICACRLMRGYFKRIAVGAVSTRAVIHYGQHVRL